MANANQYTDASQDYMEQVTGRLASFVIWEDEPLMDVLLWSFPGRYVPLTEEARLINEAEHKICHIFENIESGVIEQEYNFASSPLPVEA